MRGELGRLSYYPTQCLSAYNCSLAADPSEHSRVDVEGTDSGDSYFLLLGINLRTKGFVESYGGVFARTVVDQSVGAEVTS